MRTLLRLKHWQLFLLTWGLPIAINVIAFSNPVILVKLFPFMMLLFASGIFGWVWAIATVLQPMLPDNVKLNVRLFKVLFTIPIVYLFVFIFWFAYAIYNIRSGESGSMGAIAALVIVVHLVSMICIFLGVRFAAKTFRSVELGRVARFSDYAGEFFLIWFSPVGLWVLQPRLNKLTQ